MTNIEHGNIDIVRFLPKMDQRRTKISLKGSYISMINIFLNISMFYDN